MATNELELIDKNALLEALKQIDFEYEVTRDIVIDTIMEQKTIAVARHKYEIEVYA